MVMEPGKKRLAFVILRTLTLSWRWPAIPLVPPLSIMLKSKTDKLHKVLISSWSKLSTLKHSGGTVLVFRFLAAVCCEQLTVQQCVVCC